MKRKLILIAGIPGVGKTSIGNFLESKYEYKHFDMEKYSRTSKIIKNADNFIAKNFKNNKHIIITWGFSPDKKTINVVNYLNKYGFRTFWFDGNKNSARRITMQRKTFDNRILKKQMSALDKWNVPKDINAKIINVFDKKGNFRKIMNIAKEIKAI
ncbi:hypothetical protein J4476_01635 [Candidatus Woesearchaeota archaeon]|nr:MAG: hypothetical protein QT09_C0012G0036 [archaeon GW2011_AR18]MBS3161377.1 hypothetical protein [Candidatus Woesearchaeota archaeon]HIH25408.1 hypothetical protein [Nanoarchaeota archaeon]